MLQTELRQTVFEVAAMKNVVGIGRATAYQIHVQHGPLLATPVRRATFLRQSAANDVHRAPSALGRLLSALPGRRARR